MTCRPTASSCWMNSRPGPKPGRIQETRKQERGQPCPRELLLTSETPGPGDPRCNLESAFRPEPLFFLLSRGLVAKVEPCRRIFHPDECPRVVRENRPRANGRWLNGGASTSLPSRWHRPSARGASPT